MNKYNKIILAGGSGFLGTVLAKHFAPLAGQVIILSRRQAPASGNIQTVLWDACTTGPWKQSLEEADGVVNLCGKNVNCRYTEANKAEIVRSRLEPTRLLAAEISKLKHPPAWWINVTSATVYRHAEDHPQDEATGETGYGFSIDVCRQWEAAFFETSLPRTRQIALRMGLYWDGMMAYFRVCSTWYAAAWAGGRVMDNNTYPGSTSRMLPAPSRGSQISAA